VEPKTLTDENAAILPPTDTTVLPTGNSSIPVDDELLSELLE
jgi:hypothetical protein